MLFSYILRTDPTSPCPYWVPWSSVPEILLYNDCIGSPNQTFGFNTVNTVRGLIVIYFKPLSYLQEEYSGWINISSNTRFSLLSVPESRWNFDFFSICSYFGLHKVPPTVLTIHKVFLHHVLPTVSSIHLFLFIATYSLFLNGLYQSLIQYLEPAVISDDFLNVL